jgi:hypothetical protein
MIAQRPDIHAHEGYAEQQKDRFSDERFQQLADRRHRDADEDQRGDCAGALTAEPRQSLHWNGHASLQRDGHVAFEQSASP